MDRGKNAKFLHTCPSEGNGHLKSQTSSTFIALQWSGAANSVHRQGNNGAPLLDLSVSPAFDPQHISAQSMAHKHFQDFSALILTWINLKEQHFWCSNLQSLFPCREMRGMNEMGTESRIHKMLTVTFHLYSVPSHTLQCPLTYVTVTCDAFITLLP